MGLGQVLILADEDDGRYPELLRLVLFETLSNDLGLADVGAGGISERVVSNEDVDTGSVKLLPGQKLVDLGARSGDSLARPIGNLGSPQALCVAAGKKQLDGC